MSASAAEKSSRRPAAGRMERPAERALPSQRLAREIADRARSPSRSIFRRPACSTPVMSNCVNTRPAAPGDTGATSQRRHGASTMPHGWGARCDGRPSSRAASRRRVLPGSRFQRGASGSSSSTHMASVSDGPSPAAATAHLNAELRLWRTISPTHAALSPHLSRTNETTLSLSRLSMSRSMSGGSGLFVLKKRLNDRPQRIGHTPEMPRR